MECRETRLEAIDALPEEGAKQIPVRDSRKQRAAGRSLGRRGPDARKGLKPLHSDVPELDFRARSILGMRPL
jgi:hypothetical protein